MCGQCGRRVPRTVATCRCGATLSALELTPRTGDAASSGSARFVRSVLAAALGGAAVVFAFVAAAAQRAQSIDDTWGRFKASCYGGTVPGGPSSFDREWFVLFEPQGLSGTVAPGCGAFFSDLRQNASTVRDAVLKAEEAARQAGVYPGVRREAKRVHRLDYPGWER